MIALVLGESGAGKSTYIKNEILSSSLENTIVSPELSELKNKKTVDTFDEDFEKIIFKPNHIYIFDDAFFLDLDNRKKFLILKSFFVRARKYNAHLFFIFHETGQVPIRMFTYFTHVIAFRFETNFLVQKQRLENYTYMYDFFAEYTKKKLKKHEKIIHSRY